MEFRHRVKIYREDESSTARFGKNMLRDILNGNPTELAELFARPDAREDVAINAIEELASHGLGQKAAILARQLVRQNPAFADTIRQALRPMATLLLDADVLKIPNLPPTE